MTFSGTIPGKLGFREIYGRFPRGRSVPGSLFRVFPGRLASCLKNIVPNSAVLTNHIFLGFSKCGNFIISYTQSTYDDVSSGSFMEVRYRLYWWLFRHHRPLKRVCDVALFDDSRIHHRLLLAVCYWPGDLTRILVYGRREHDGNISHSVSCYMTVTAVPPLYNCALCVQAASTLSEDDLASTECRVRCLHHCYTVHTSLELVQPYPAFHPQLCLKCPDRVLVNTGNFLHVLTLSCHAPLAASPPFAADDAGSECFSGTLSCLEVDVGDVDVCSPCASPASSLADRVVRPWRFDIRMLLYRSSLSATASSARFRKQLRTATSGCDAYEFLEDEEHESRSENLSTFRKRRLADKKYEFSDENSENVPQFRPGVSGIECVGAARHAGIGGEGRGARHPLPRLSGGINSKRRRVPSAASTVGSDDDIPSTPTVVLRPIDGNSESGAGEPASPRGPFWLAATDSDVESVASGGVRPAATRSCCVQVSRVYAELDDEGVSVITDVEEDELSVSTGYHHALPIQVNGTAYSQLQMVSRAKADRSGVMCVRVHQYSLDVEHYCHEISQKLCAQSNKKYWFCNDYDVEIVDVCGETGEVVAVAVVLIQATNSVSSNSTAPIHRASGSLYRRQYCGHFMFGWCLHTGRYRLLASSQLLELSERHQQPPADRYWHPSKLLSQQLRLPRLSPPSTSHQSVVVMTNSSKLLGSSLRSIVNWDNMAALLLHEAST